jgi:hypothetical protein
MGDERVAASGGDTWLLNLTALTEQVQGVNLSGWVLNITALVEDLPLSEYVPRGAAVWYQIVVTLLGLALSTRWFLTKYAAHRSGSSPLSLLRKGNPPFLRPFPAESRVSLLHLSLTPLSLRGAQARAARMVLHPAAVQARAAHPPARVCDRGADA